METRTNTKSQSIELGKVKWLRDYNKVIEESKLKDKPVLLFFQEIPGCATCVNFGREVLSHPLMVEFIENEFIPLAIFNNIPGDDSKILALYNEPSWNNPVAHFIDGQGRDIIPKLANNYHPLGMYDKLIQVLDGLKRPIPKYAILLGEDLNMKYGNLKTTIYWTPCFWSGETSLAQHPAVKYTEAGWIGRSEVVKVYFDGSEASLVQLDDFAMKEGCLQVDDHQDYRVDESPQYYLSRSPFCHLPLSRAQRTKINLALPYQKQPESYLSPKQALVYQDILEKTGNRDENMTYKEDIEQSWKWTYSSSPNLT